MPEHHIIDQRDLDLHKVIAERLRQNPDLLSIARKRLTFLSTTLGANSMPYVHQWRSIIDQGVDACIKAATDPSDRGNDLRQMSPLRQIMSHDERMDFRRTWEKSHGT